VDWWGSQLPRAGPADVPAPSSRMLVEDAETPTAIRNAATGHRGVRGDGGRLPSLPSTGIRCTSSDMDAREKRYRQRLKLQAALARVLEVLTRNAVAGIPPDRTTGKLAAQVVVFLTRFTLQAGVELPNPTTEGSDLARYAKLLADRKKATKARYRRKIARCFRRQTGR
jgi:hypothetical protein